MLERIISSVETGLHRKVQTSEALRGGMNNKLFRLRMEDQVDLLAKAYYQDDRNRLDREYSALNFFRSKGSTCTPVPYLREGQEFAVYSFEDSVSKQPEGVTIAEVDKMVDFVCQMHAYSPSSISDKFDNAVMPVFSFEQFFSGARFRIDKFLDYTRQSNVHGDIKNFNDSFDIEGLATQVEDKAKRMSGNQYSEPLDIEKRRLSPADFGLHNMLFRPGGDICFIDFEYFGWDDPARIISSFYHHDGNSKMGQDKRRHFVEGYKSGSPLPPDVLSRVDTAMLLSSAEWIGTMLWGMTPEKIQSREYSDPDFNRQRYLNMQISKLTGRIYSLNEDLQIL